MRTNWAGVFLLSALVIRPVMAQQEKRSSVSWEEVSQAMSVLPSPAKGVKRGRYSVSDEERSEVRSRIERLKAKGDVIPPIVERLKRRPHDESSEAEAYNLVSILKESPDERALSVLEEVARSTPTITYFIRDEGGRRFRYPYHLEAQEIVEKIKAQRALNAWKDELRSNDRAARSKALADAYWSPMELNEFRWRSAGQLLGTELSMGERLSVLEARMPQVLTASTPWGMKVVSRMTADLGWLGRNGASRQTVIRLLDEIATKGSNPDTRAYAGQTRKDLMALWDELDKKRGQ